MSAPVPDTDVEHDGRLELLPTRSGAVRWSVALIGVLLVAEITARVLVSATPAEIRWYDAGAQLRIEAIEDDGQGVDVVFAGTSSAGQALVPEQFTAVDPAGRDAYNVALAGAVPAVMGPWLVDEIVPRLEPDVVVWGLTPLDFSTSYGDEQAVAYGSAVETADGWMAELDRRVGSVSQLVEARRILRSASALFGSDADEREEQIEAAGVVMGPDGERVDFAVDLGEERRAITEARLAGFAVDPVDTGDVEAIVSATGALQAAGVEVVFVELPLPDRFRSELPAGDDDADLISREIRSLGERLGVDVISLPRALGETRFVDFTHVDQDTADVVTEWLARGLDALAVVPPGDCEPLGVDDEFGFAIALELCRSS